MNWWGILEERGGVFPLSSTLYLVYDKTTSLITYVYFRFTTGEDLARLLSVKWRGHNIQTWEKFLD